MKYIQGDLLEGDWTFAAHVANSYNVMGSGIAYFLRKKWPEVFDADTNCELSTDEKNGFYSEANIGHGRKVFNLYAMRGIGNDGHPINRNLSYDDFYDSVFRMCLHLAQTNSLVEDLRIAIPYNIGCCRAGGDWNIVESILLELEKLFDVTFDVYVFMENETNKTSSVTIPK